MSLIKSESCDHCDYRLALLELHQQLTLNHISILLTRQATLEKEIERLMATQAEFDAQVKVIADELAATKAAAAQDKEAIGKTLADFQAQLDEAKTGQPLDINAFQAIIDSAKANTAAVQDLGKQATDGDPGPVVPPPPVNG